MAYTQNAHPPLHGLPEELRFLSSWIPRIVVGVDTHVQGIGRIFTTPYSLLLRPMRQQFALIIRRRCSEEPSFLSSIYSNNRTFAIDVRGILELSPNIERFTAMLH